MIYNKQLTSVLLTVWLLTSCNSLPNIKVSIEDNQTAEKATTTAKKEETYPKIKADNSKTVPQKKTNNIIAHQEYSTETNSGIQEGQFVHDGFKNKLKVEIVKVKRIQNPETKKRDTVAVSFQVSC